MKMSIKSFIAIITVIFFVFATLYPKIARANPWVIKQVTNIEESDDEEKVTPMKTGDRAPYPGVLFSVPAAAKIQVERETADEKCQIKIDRDVGLKKAELTLLLSNEKAAKESAQERLKEISKLKDDQIMFMTKQIEKHQKKERIKDDLLGVWITLGFLGGAVTVLAGAYAIKQIGR